jgi:hypothetical protein
VESDGVACQAFCCSTLFVSGQYNRRQTGGVTYSACTAICITALTAVVIQDERITGLMECSDHAAGNISAFHTGCHFRIPSDCHCSRIVKLGPGVHTANIAGIRLRSCNVLSSLVLPFYDRG